jgi:hypothetical protein
MCVSLLALFAQPSAAQRARFPTMIQTSGQTTGSTATTAQGVTATATQPGWSAAGSSLAQTTTTPPGTPSTTAPAGSYTTTPSYPTTPSTTPSGSTAPAYTRPAAPTGVGPTAPATPTYTAPGSSAAPAFAPSYGAAPVATPGPAATFNGNILPPPSWDPYATPSMQQPSLLPQDPYLQTPPSLQYPTTAGLTRFLQEVRVDYTWMDGKNDKPTHFSYSDVELTATFAVPFLYNQQNPLLITPGFDFYFIDSSINVPRLYDAFLDTEWNPQITPYFGGELGFRLGIYSDFEKWNGRSLRYTGHSLMSLMLSPSFKLKGGIVYLDRVDVKMLPAGGVVWTPNQDWRFDILFPNPRFSRRLCTSGVSDWWCYVRGEYGGDSWVISAPVNDQVDYNDMRVALGIESVRRGGGGNFLFEVGYAFKRELVSRSDRTHPLDVPETFFLRAGLAF